MASLSIVLLALTFTQPSPQLAVKDPTGCVDAAALAPALRDALPEPWRGVAANLSLTVDVVAGPGGEASRLSFHLALEGSPSVTLSREMRVIQADCPSLARLIATVVGRHLADLPREDWPVSPAPPPPFEPGGASEPVPPTRESPGSTWSLNLRMGLEAGLDTALWGGAFGADGAVVWTEGFGLRLGGEVIAFGPVSVDEGAAQLTTVMGRVGPVWDIPLGSMSLSLAAGVGAGLTIGTGSDFERNVSTVTAAVSGWSDATLRTSWDLTFTLGVSAAIVRPRLTVEGAEQTVDMPAGRFGVSVGYHFGG